MIDILLLMLLNALAIVGICLAFGNGMIFDRIGRWIESKVHYNLTMPLFNCPTCMASIHSVLPFWMTYEFGLNTLLLYIVYVPALSALSTWAYNQTVKE